MSEHLYGRNAVREALRSHRRHIHTLLLAKGIDDKTRGEFEALASRLGVPVKGVPRPRLDSIAEHHQGVALEVGRYPYGGVDDMLAAARKSGELPFIVMLDHLQDPQNLGALLRTADCAGVHGVVIPGRRAASVTPAVVSASAGAAEHLRVAQVTNLPRELDSLKSAGVWVVGLEDVEGAARYDSADLAGVGVVLVIGSEGRGLSRLVREKCDIVIGIPMRGHVGSLNASVAGALAMYEVWRSRRFATG